MVMDLIRFNKILSELSKIKIDLEDIKIEINDILFDDIRIEFKCMRYEKLDVSDGDYYTPPCITVDKVEWDKVECRIFDGDTEIPVSDEFLTKILDALC